MSAKIDNAFLKENFPPERTDQFFEVLFGGAEEGAYDIVLTVRNETEDHVEMAYELHQRPGKCLVCSLTYGLSTVFRKHPVIDAAGTAAKVAEKWAGIISNGPSGRPRKRAVPCTGFPSR